MGRKGVGKKKKMREIMGIIRKRKGKIKMEGKDIMSVNLKRIEYEGMGFVNEERGIFERMKVNEKMIIKNVVEKGGGSKGEMYMEEI